MSTEFGRSCGHVELLEDEHRAVPEVVKAIYDEMNEKYGTDEKPGYTAN
jgi:hypothetical protein